MMLKGFKNLFSQHMFLHEQQRQDFFSFIKGMSLIVLGLSVYFDLTDPDSRFVKSEFARELISIIIEAGLVFYIGIKFASQVSTFSKQQLFWGKVSFVIGVAYLIYAICFVAENYILNSNT